MKGIYALSPIFFSLSHTSIEFRGREREPGRRDTFDMVPGVDMTVCEEDERPGVERRERRIAFTSTCRERERERERSFLAFSLSLFLCQRSVIFTRERERERGGSDK